MRLRLLVAALLLAAACSDEQGGSTPAERAQKARGMSEEYWKVYSGTESGVSDQPAKTEPAPGTGQSPAQAPPGKQ